ncbi:GTPase [Pseudoduganella sp. SL102]|uniref:GTPase n=1 Tax=Pseudoduganella sp. SL102 TaxID=2995154 RepID=UPI00248D00FC|nr:GTPase [Pseudoduganella sp. SL102]WBS03803.1 GTPase [Pseudoduganella sp. SL102]
MPSPVIATLVTGRRALDRESAIAARLPVTGTGAPSPAGAQSDAPVAVIIEGLADPLSPLADAPGVQVHRIAPGCLCCAGNVVLRVTLNRLLRRPPAQLYISLADATHVGQLRAMLSAPPYDTLLSLCDDVAAPAVAS